MKKKIGTHHVSYYFTEWTETENEWISILIQESQFMACFFFSVWKEFDHSTNSNRRRERGKRREEERFRRLIFFSLLLRMAVN